MEKYTDRIGETFKGQTLFISGATGFVGKVLIEKLLRCTDVHRLYLLIREKKGKTPQERLKEMFNNVLFTVLKEQRPDSIKKCVPIVGDVIEEDLGISDKDRNTLINEVDIIYHSAATTRFDDTMKYAVQMNTRGTKYMLDLAAQCKKLKVFVHVSSAYVFPKEKILYEKFYDPPANPHEIMQSVKWLNEEQNPQLTKELLGDIPNTYTYSKALAEALVVEQVGKLPVIITRPAVVIPCFQEPIPGWFNNLQGPMGIFVGAGKGVIRSMYMDSKSHANLIPADSTVNAIMIATWNYLTERKQLVYNICVPEEDIKINWEEIIELGRDVNSEVPFNQMLWYPGGGTTKSRAWHNFNFVFFQIIPALIVDLIMPCIGYKPFLFNINMRIHKGQEMFEYYTTKAWDFDLSNFMKVRNILNPLEKQKYKVDSEGVDIRKYLVDCMFYARRHIFKETDDMLPAARRTMTILFVLDRIVKILFYLAVGYYLYQWVLVPLFSLK